MVNCGVPPLGTTALTSTTFPSFSSPTLESSYNTIFTTRSLCQALPHRIPLLEGRYHLLSQESQAPVHGFLGEEPAGIQFRRDPRDPQHFLELIQTVDNALRTAKDHSGLQEILISGVGQPLVACLPHLITFSPSAPQGILKELAHAAKEGLDALLGFFNRFLVTWGDVHREAHVDIASITGVPGFHPLFFVVAQIGLQVVHIHNTQPQEDGIPKPPNAAKAVSATGGYAYGGIGFLIGQGGQCRVRNAVVFPLVGKRLPRPRLQDNIQGFLEALFALS